MSTSFATNKVRIDLILFDIKFELIFFRYLQSTRMYLYVKNRKCYDNIWNDITYYYMEYIWWIPMIVSAISTFIVIYNVADIHNKIKYDKKVESNKQIEKYVIEGEIHNYRASNSLTKALYYLITILNNLWAHIMLLTNLKKF